MPPVSGELTAPPSPEAEKWLAIAEDKGKDIQERIAAVVQLQQLKEQATVSRLIKKKWCQFKFIIDMVMSIMN